MLPRGVSAISDEELESYYTGVDCWDTLLTPPSRSNSLSVEERGQRYAVAIMLHDAYRVLVGEPLRARQSTESLLRGLGLLKGG